MADTAPIPLVVDLDGSLASTNTLHESVIKLIRSSPLHLLFLPFWLLRGRAKVKDAIACRTVLAADRLPYNESLLAYLRYEKKKGRRIILAPAAHAKIAAGVSEHLALFDQVLATEPGRNLEGTAKLAAIREKVGEEFVYAGNSAADTPIWRAAKRAILVGVPPKLAASIRGQVPIEREFPSNGVDLRLWLRAIRAHQWLKNLLIFVPVLTAFSFLNLAKVEYALVGFLAFSLAASATYIINDLWDLESDRAHVRKRRRPFASGEISIAYGIAFVTFAIPAAFALALAVSYEFSAMLGIYLVLTTAYSWLLKEHVLVDVLVLSMLYTLRILAGSVACGIKMSSWLVAFSAFMFLSLALVKRCSELKVLEQGGLSITRGRDYRVSDLGVLWPLGVGAALSAVVIFGLFINAPETQARYATPDALWLVALGLVYWVARLWIKTSRGEMNDDPLIYAIKDRSCLFTTFWMIITVLSAHFLSLKALL